MAKREKETQVKAKSSKKRGERDDSPICGGFDLIQIESLIGLMKENGLTEFNLENGKFKIQLKRQSSELVPAVCAPPVPAVTPVLPPAPVAEPKKVEDDSSIEIITSPMVGAFYASPSPDAPPFVAVGDIVRPDQTVCIIEAMKVFNEIQAEVAGKIVAVLVKDGDPVEFGKPLFKVDTRG